MSESTILNRLKRKKVNSWIEIAARFGFACKGILYIIVGYLAFKIVLGIGGKTADIKDVLLDIDKQAHPFGDILLAFVAVGLFSHVFWRFMQSAFNIDNFKINFKNIISRIGYFSSVIFYGALTYYAFKIIFGLSGSSSSTQSLVASVISEPSGRWIVGLIGLCIGGSGVFQIIFGIFSEFETRFNIHKMIILEEKLSRYISMSGLIARGIVFLLISFFLIQAAVENKPQKAGGIGKALLETLHQPYGSLLLSAASIGLAAYGIYCILLTRFRKIPLH